MFDVQSHLCILTAETGEVFYDNGIDFSIFNIVNHALEFRPFKVGSAPPIVAIVIDDLYAVLFAVLR